MIFNKTPLCLTAFTLILAACSPMDRSANRAIDKETANTYNFNNASSASKQEENFVSAEPSLNLDNTQDVASIIVDTKAMSGVAAGNNSASSIFKRPLTPSPSPASGSLATRNTPTFLTNPQIVELFAGRTAFGERNDKRGKWIEYLDRTGRAIFQSHRNVVTEGKWWVSNNQVCFSYDGSQNGSCSKVERNNQGYQLVQTNGTREFLVTKFEVGDTAELNKKVLIRN